MATVDNILLKDITFSGLDIFTLENLFEISSLSHKSTEIALRLLNDNDLILKIEKGKYCKFDFKDELVIGNFLSRDGGIAYWTAMNYHGLTEQISNTIFVQTSYKKPRKTIFGTKYVFVQIKPEKLTGYKTLGYGNHQYRISDLEKTIVDCFDLPNHSGGYPEVIKAFANADIKARKLVRYCKAINNISVVKRLAYLTELLCKKNMEYFIDYALSVRNKKYNLFEHNGEQKGKGLKKWRLILNMNDDEILEIANS